MSLTTTTAPLQPAVDMMAEKTVVGSPMNSAAWAELPEEIRRRAMFSATVESERLLQEMKDRLQQRLEGTGTTLMDKNLFIAKMRNILSESGYDESGQGINDITNLKARARLALIFNFNISSALGYGRYMLDLDPAALEVEPAYELIRVRQRREPRDWPEIWAEHGGQFYPGPNPDYPEAGRMIALKTDSIWSRISRFGSPWPPFDFNSGMGLAGIGRAEALALGLIKPKQKVVAKSLRSFNSGVEASLAGIPQDARDRLAEALQGIATIEGDTIKMIAPDHVAEPDSGEEAVP